jgi:MFS family permease
MGSSSGGVQLIGVVIAGAIAVFVYTDAKKRGMNAVGWAIGTFLLCIVILPLYLIIRKPVLVAGMPGSPAVTPLPPTYVQPPMQPPPTFSQPPAGTPPAGTPARFCPNCGQPHEGTAKFCPNCGASM